MSSWSSCSSRKLPSPWSSLDAGEQGCAARVGNVDHQRSMRLAHRAQGQERSVGSLQRILNRRKAYILKKCSRPMILPSAERARWPANTPQSQESECILREQTSPASQRNLSDCSCKAFAKHCVREWKKLTSIREAMGMKILIPTSITYLQCTSFEAPVRNPMSRSISYYPKLFQAQVPCSQTPRC